MDYHNFLRLLLRHLPPPLTAPLVSTSLLQGASGATLTLTGVLGLAVIYALLQIRGQGAWSSLGEWRLYK